MSETKRRLTGIKPTGVPHIGNYFASIKPFLHPEPGVESLYFIANYHSLTTQREGGPLLHSTYDVAATLLALGIDLDHTVLFRQTDVPEVAELSWILSCFTGMGLLERAHAYKDAVTKGRDLHAGLFTYPVLMAADILLYDIDEVPVGSDQKQHVEIARDIAGSFNHAYGQEIFKLPNPKIDETVMIIPGLDGKKMSKSYGNVIGIFEEEKSLKKKIMAIPTDSTPLEEPKRVEGSTIFSLFELFGTDDAILDFKKRMNQGGMGWGHAKVELFECMRDYFSPYRQHYETLMASRSEIDRVLLEGAERARAMARPKLQAVRQVVGFSS